MGMFDNPTPFRDTFKEQEVFTLEDAKLGSSIRTDYGDGTPVLLKINGKWYSLFGQGIQNQVSRMDRGDLPADVSVRRVPTRSGQMVKLLVPKGQENTEAVAVGDDDIPF